jgi:hypothetical protein
MASLPRVLAQADPAAGVTVDLYTCPAKTRDVVNVWVCNRDVASARLYSVLIAPGGAALDSSQYLTFLRTIQIRDYEVLRGITLGPGDVIRCSVDAQQVSFTVFGIEMDGWLEGQVP